jgi:hypothetical protein
VASAIRHFRAEFEDYVKNGDKIKDVKYYFHTKNMDPAAAYSSL